MRYGLFFPRWLLWPGIPANTDSLDIGIVFVMVLRASRLSAPGLADTILMPASSACSSAFQINSQN